MQHQLTKQDIQKMEEEIEYRKLVVRKEALEDVKTARAHGDLSENFEYKAAKQFKNQNESRIRYLERMIKTADIIDDASEDDEVGIHKSRAIEFCIHEVNLIKVVVLVTNGLIKSVHIQLPTSFIGIFSNGC